ncbi:unnamed protein product, partial [marine sediment metagenome]
MILCDNCRLDLTEDKTMIDSVDFSEGFDVELEKKRTFCEDCYTVLC